MSSKVFICYFLEIQIGSEKKTKLSELVFIGKDLNKEELDQQFKKCMYAIKVSWTQLS
ncbi:GTP-binding protein [Bacillus sp. SA1-12]|uniref:GTP-binding protein n=1 Tax=Bacillus sp. SA1-12 TaxID=1455638 RepID=UPI00269DDD99